MVVPEGPAPWGSLVSDTKALSALTSSLTVSSRDCTVSSIVKRCFKLFSCFLIYSKCTCCCFSKPFCLCTFSESSCSRSFTRSSFLGAGIIIFSEVLCRHDALEELERFDHVFTGRFPILQNRRRRRPHPSSRRTSWRHDLWLSVTHRGRHVAWSRRRVAAQ